jgi:hypothetical protein
MGAGHEARELWQKVSWKGDSWQSAVDVRGGNGGRSRHADQIEIAFFLFPWCSSELENREL